MINLLELLRPRGLEATVSAKMVRHEESKHPSSDLLRDGLFEVYQAHQGKTVFNCDVVVSFLGRPQRRALLYGVYSVKGVEQCTSAHRRRLTKYPEWAAAGNYYYSLERLKGFEDLEGRVVIDWGLSTRSWHQWLRDREIVEVLPTGFVSTFPGYEQVLLSYDELARIVRDEAGNRVWHRMLAAVSAVYLILDRNTGKQYVGSASGEEGLLHRWASYVKTGHGGNKQLKGILAAELEYRRNFSFSILQTFARVTPSGEVLAAERIHKAKLGTLAHGLNDN